MFTHFSTALLVATLAAVATAAPSELEARGGSGSSSSCNTGPIQCCQQTQEANPTTLNYFSGLLGIALPTVEGLLGLGCSPLTVVGVGSGSTCTAQTVCCTNNQFSGLINLGCSPINLSL